VCLRHETSKHYFSCSGGTDTDSTTIALGHIAPNLCFFLSAGYVGHVVHSGASGSRNVDALFFRFGRDQYITHKIALEHVTLNMCFYIQRDLWFT
jgi:hypothetical protein